MNTYTGLLLLSSVVCLMIGILVYQLNRKERLNKLFTLTFLFASYWALTDFLMRNSVNTNEAYFWNKTSFLWPFSLALLFHFSLVFTKNRLLTHKVSYAVIYAPAVFLSILDLTTGLVSGPIISEVFGFTYSVPSNPIFYMIGNIWGVILGVLSLFVCLRYYYRIEEKTYKDPIKLVTVGFAIPFIINIITTVIPPYFNSDVPSLGNISTMFVSIFVGYAIWKYYLFSLNPALAAENILTTMPDSLILADIKAKILRVNERLVDFTGYAKEELIGKSIAELCVENQEETWATVLDELVTKKIIINRELILQNKSGAKLNIFFSGSIVKSKSGHNIGMVCVIHDVTDMKRIEEKLVKAEKLASIGELAGQIGHDLRNPLAGIKNGIYLIKKKDYQFSGAKRKEVIGIIEEAIEDSNRIINSLVDYSSDLNLQPEQCTLKSLVLRALSNIQVPDHLNIVNNATDDVKMFLDVQSMEKVFASIIRNAIEASPEKGSIEIQSILKGQNIEISFTDSGVGIPEGVLLKLFAPLVTTKAKGMGMGLAICKRIVEFHDGKIAVESTVGKGATFIINLPIKLSKSEFAQIQMFTGVEMKRATFV